MRAFTNPRQLAVLLLSFCPRAISHPGPQATPGIGRGGNPAPAPVVNWVTVDPLGLARTITPTVFTIDGARTTANNPPDSLTSTATYTLSPGGTDHPELASTYTGLAPVASATGTTNDAGAFLACENVQATELPFCLPKPGSVLYPGRTYYITWSTNYFVPENRSIAFQARYPDNTGFTTMYWPASKGFYAWTIPHDFLSSDYAPLTSLNVSLALVYENTETPDPNDLRALEGPSVIIANEPRIDPNGSGNKRSVVAIAVPIIVVLVLLALGSFCFWSWRRHGVVPILGRRRKSGSGGYGVRQSRSQRVGADGGGVPAGGFGGNDKQGPNVGIQLTDRDSWSPTAGQATSGRNVFREELRRQERQG